MFLSDWCIFTSFFPKKLNEFFIVHFFATVKRKIFLIDSKRAIFFYFNKFFKLIHVKRFSKFSQGHHFSFARKNSKTKICSYNRVKKSE